MPWRLAAYLAGATSRYAWIWPAAGEATFPGSSRFGRELLHPTPQHILVNLHFLRDLRHRDPWSSQQLHRFPLELRAMPAWTLPSDTSVTCYLLSEVSVNSGEAQ